eukprot:GCRY01002020.1.p1 GENE.GCRY01002020.1~~GCRY01002020.1.p1  ORF type:complete len:463 (-),score=103.24 GCRY01002020.1:764-2152(-)
MSDLIPISANPEAGFRKQQLGEGFASIASCIFAVCNTMVGGGTVTLPYAFRSAGLIPSIILLFIVGALSRLTIQLLAVMIEKTGIASYDRLGHRSFPKYGSAGVQAVELVNTLGCLSSYLVIMTDQAEGLLDNAGVKDGILHQRWFILVVLILIFALPLSMLRNLDSLRYSNFFSLACLLYTGFLVAIRGVEDVEHHHACSPKLFKWDLGIFAAFPIIALSFTCQINVCQVYRELKNRSPARMSIVSTLSVLTCLCFYLFLGIFGYVQHCGATPGDILKEYPADDRMVQIARLALLISFGFTYPLLCAPCRHAVFSVTSSMFSSDSKKVKQPAPSENTHLVNADTADYAATKARVPLELDDDDEGSHTHLLPYRLHIIITLCIIAVSFLVALAVPNVENIFDLMGAMTAASLAFVMPSLFYLQIVPGHNTRSTKVLFVFGVFAVVACTSAISYNLITTGHPN